ncbi:CDP-glycerol glycerophosphotransferase family protein [Mycobacterium gastri]|uniref:CDP-glycerol glycerophosphotransferase family protein n=1 Tax=Mycobacterium gastri TaxID=1777 RepID=UPI0004AC90A3|nr:CDP-glycerol glycerophosphotransferase family protein [Mycobacterium gastri]
MYFADDPCRLYQLRQWVPVFELLDQAHPVLVVTRHPQTYVAVGRLTRLRRVCVPKLADLVQLYDDSDLKAAIYVNNSALNFHSLAATRMIHIHVNHGESDKVCMASNQAKAYDRVLVAGEAALRRYRAALIEFDERRFVPVGRPQLDLRPEPVLPPTARRTVLYAPTWEGENAANNFTSVDVHGPAIAAAALALPNVRVVYKPHPRVASSTDPGMATAHRRIVGLVTEAARREPAAGHRVLINADILAVFPGCSVLITDISSVGLDFLYLHVDKPLFVTDRRNDRARLDAEAPVSRCADVVDAATVGSLTGTLAQRLARDAYRAEREAMRRYYFGDLAPGESTRRFLGAVEEALAARQTDRRHLAPAEAP